MESKNLNEQLKDLEEILFKNETLKEVLRRLEKSNLKNYYVGAGCINQTVFNYLHGFRIDANINDYDIVYYDEDTSYEKEDIVIKYVEALLSDLNIKLDIKNEARVHIWYNEKYGKNIKPYKSVEDAIARWGTTITCIGVRLENNKLIVTTPYGLNDLFNMIIRPVKIDFKEEDYLKKVNKWKKKWPKLTIMLGKRRKKMDNLEFMEKFKPKERCIKDFKYWIVCIRESQTTLGSAVILLKRQTESVGKVLKEEAAEFPSVIKWYEETCKEKFGAVKFNYLIMMMHDNFVHYHAFPRYDNDIKIFNEIWHDDDWPRAIDFKKKNVINESKLLEILNFMSK